MYPKLWNESTEKGIGMNKERHGITIGIERLNCGIRSGAQSFRQANT